MVRSFLGLFFHFLVAVAGGAGEAVSTEKGTGGCRGTEDWQPAMAGRPA